MIFPIVMAVATGAGAQTIVPPSSPAAAQPAVAIVTPVAPPATPPVAPLVLPADTPIELMAVTEVSTADATPGKRFRMRVNKPVEIDGRIVIPVGALAYGEVIDAKESEMLGEGGALTARLLYLQLGDAQIPLEGNVAAKGRGAASGVGAVLGAGLLGLFSRGNNAKIKAGEIVMGFVAKDAPLDLPAPAAQTTGTPAPTAAMPQPASSAAK